MVKVIADPGSTHMAKIAYAKELIDIAIDNHCWAIKFQLFKGLKPNIELPREYWHKLWEYSRKHIILFASVFDMEAIELLREHITPYVKFSFYHGQWWEGIAKAKQFAKVIVSCSPQNAYLYQEDIIKLLCIPEYPVMYKVDFKEVFKQYSFDGFSDHTLGYSQTLAAIEAGAGIIEKHITLAHSDIKCPDSTFALKPKQLKEMMYDIKIRFSD